MAYALLLPLNSELRQACRRLGCRSDYLLPSRWYVAPNFAFNLPTFIQRGTIFLGKTPWDHDPHHHPYNRIPEPNPLGREKDPREAIIKGEFEFTPGVFCSLSANHTKLIPPINTIHLPTLTPLSETLGPSIRSSPSICQVLPDGRSPKTAHRSAGLGTSRDSFPNL
jgi:hypothetical protein